MPLTHSYLVLSPDRHCAQIEMWQPPKTSSQLILARCASKKWLIIFGCCFFPLFLFDLCFYLLSLALICCRRIVSDKTTKNNYSAQKSKCNKATLFESRKRKPTRNWLKLSHQGAVSAEALTPAGKIEHHSLLQLFWCLGLTSVFVIVLPCLSQMQGCVPWQTDQRTADTAKINRFSGSSEKPLISSLVSLGASYRRNPHRKVFLKRTWLEIIKCQRPHKRKQETYD